MTSSRDSEDDNVEGQHISSVIGGRLSLPASLELHEFEERLQNFDEFVKSLRVRSEEDEEEEDK